jgi:regulator of replication initiation timing
MDDPMDALTELLLNSILPNLKAVQVSQGEQIAANDRLEISIEHLRTHLDSEFNKLAAQLIACRAEMAALQAAIQTLQTRSHGSSAGETSLIH